MGLSRGLFESDAHFTLVAPSTIMSPKPTRLSSTTPPEVSPGALDGPTEHHGLDQNAVAEGPSRVTSGRSSERAANDDPVRLIAYQVPVDAHIDVGDLGEDRCPPPAGAGRLTRSCSPSGSSGSCTTDRSAWPLTLRSRRLPPPHEARRQWLSTAGRSLSEPDEGVGVGRDAHGRLVSVCARGIARPKSSHAKSGQLVKRPAILRVGVDV